MEERKRAKYVADLLRAVVAERGYKRIADGWFAREGEHAFRLTRVRASYYGPWAFVDIGAIAKELVQADVRLGKECHFEANPNAVPAEDVETFNLALDGESELDDTARIARFHAGFERKFEPAFTWIDSMENMLACASSEQPWRTNPYGWLPLAVAKRLAAEQP